MLCVYLKKTVYRINISVAGLAAMPAMDVNSNNTK